MNKVVWLGNDFVPWFFPHIGFCPNEKAWIKVCEELNEPGREYPIKYSACCSYFIENKIPSCVVTCNVEYDPNNKYRILGFMAHEAVHCWEQAIEFISEESPSSEFMAYSIQGIVLGLMEAYDDTRGKLK